MSLSARVLIGLLLGVAVGLFLGEEAAPLGVLGDAFVLLLQMTVLPFVVVSLVHGLGCIRPEQARSLALRAGAFVLLFVALSVLLVLLFPLAFPDWPSASFFSRQLVEPPSALDLVALYIPANPFTALAESTVPAVVIFSTALGVAVMRARRKQALLDTLSTLLEALIRIAGYVGGFAPYGVFALVAEAAGTMDVGSFQGLQLYLLAFSLLCTVLALWWIPILVTALAPLSYRELVLRTRGALLTAFATGSVFVVLPVLAARSRELLAREDVAPGDSAPVVDVIVPIAFALPTPGTLLKLAFVLFGGWLTGFRLGPAELAQLVAIGPLTIFDHPFSAISFLLDLFRVPSDTLDLFVLADSVVGFRFASLAGAVYVLALALLSGCALSGTLRVRWRRLAIWGGVGLVLSVGSLVALRVGFTALGPPADTYALFVDRPGLIGNVREREVEISPEAPADPRRALDRIRDRGRVRVAWTREALPYAFRNEAGRLVGFDMEMARELALDLGVGLELALVEDADIPVLLDRGLVDVVMAGYAVEPARMPEVAFTDAYLDETLSFVVRDGDRKRFDSREKLLRLESPRIAVIQGAPHYAELLQRFLPDARLIPIETPRQFFRGAVPEAEALLFVAQSGSSWCLIYPEFAVVVPHPAPVSVPFAYVVGREEREMRLFLNQWIELKKKDGTIAYFFDYWMRGKEPPDRHEPRWSIARDVLGWLE